MTQKNSNALSSRIMLWAMIAFACVLLGGGVWFVRGWRDLFTHITPSGSSNIALSTSMEPFDITLKSKVWDYRKKGELDTPVEWDIRLPRAYVDDLQGQNGAIRHVGRVANGNTDVVDRFKALLAVHVLADGQTLEPYALMAADQKKFDDNTMVIKVYNTDADWWIAKNDLCVQEEHRDDAAKKVGGPDQFNATCFPTIKFCTIYTHLDGWLLTINASKQLYAQPEKVCSLAKKFVNGYTVKRDVYPYSEPIHYKFPGGSNGTNN